MEENSIDIQSGSFLENPQGTPPLIEVVQVLHVPPALRTPK